MTVVIHSACVCAWQDMYQFTPDLPTYTLVSLLGLTRNIMLLVHFRVEKPSTQLVIYMIIKSALGYYAALGMQHIASTWPWVCIHTVHTLGTCHTAGNQPVQSLGLASTDDQTHKESLIRENLRGMWQNNTTTWPRDGWTHYTDSLLWLQSSICYWNYILYMYALEICMGARYFIPDNSLKYKMYIHAHVRLYINSDVSNFFTKLHVHINVLHVHVWVCSSNDNLITRTGLLNTHKLIMYGYIIWW